MANPSFLAVQPHLEVFTLLISPWQPAGDNGFHWRAATSPSRAELRAQLNPPDEIWGDFRKCLFAGGHPKLWMCF